MAILLPVLCKTHDNQSIFRESTKLIEQKKIMKTLLMAQLSAILSLFETFTSCDVKDCWSTLPSSKDVCGKAPVLASIIRIDAGESQGGVGESPPMESGVTGNVQGCRHSPNCLLPVHGLNHRIG